MHELALAFGLFAQTLGKYHFLTNDADLAKQLFIIFTIPGLQERLT